MRAGTSVHLSVCRPFAGSWRNMEVPFEQLGLHVGPASDLLRFYQAKLKLADGEREGVLQRLADCDVRSD